VFWTARGLSLLLLIAVFRQYWSHLDTYLSSLDKPVVPELGIGIGTAISGIIAISFSLSLFAIQQVADRGTPATVQAYARDRVLKLIYWALAALATIGFGVALLKTERIYHTVAVTMEVVALLISFVLLNLHFRRVVLFADPRYTVSRILTQGKKQIRRLQILRDNIGGKGSPGS
jgi:hypothetical protein